MWKLVDRKDLAQGDVIALVHNDKVLMEGTYLVDSSGYSCVYTDTSLIPIPNTRLKYESSKVFQENRVSFQNTFTVYGEENPDYKFYKWESIPVKFDLNKFR